MSNVAIFCAYFGKKIWATSPHIKCEYCGSIVCEMLEPANEVFHEYCNISSDEWKKKIISYANTYGDNSFDVESYNNRENKIHENFEKRIHQQTSQPSTQVTCPYCKSTNTKKISAVSRAGSILGFGIFSKKIGKEWHCNDCGSDF